MKQTIGRHDYHDVFARMSQAEITMCLRTLSASKRGMADKPYAPPVPVAIEVEHPGGGEGRYIIKVSGLSRQSLGCLTGTFVHPGSKCTVHLATSEGEYLSIHGHVDHCRHMASHLHYVSLIFDDALDLTALFGEDNKPASANPAPAEVCAAATTLMNSISEIERYCAPRDLASVVNALLEDIKPGAALLTRDEIASADRIAITDANGKVLAVNLAWCRFANAGGYTGDGYVGTNYCDTLERASATSEDAREALADFRSIRLGEHVERRYAYECSGPNESQQWYQLYYTTRTYHEKSVIIVRHALLDTSLSEAELAA